MFRYKLQSNWGNASDIQEPTHTISRIDLCSSRDDIVFRYRLNLLSIISGRPVRRNRWMKGSQICICDDPHGCFFSLKTHVKELGLQKVFFPFQAPYVVDIMLQDAAFNERGEVIKLGKVVKPPFPSLANSYPG